MGARSQSQWSRELGISQANISRYLAGETPGTEFLRAIAEHDRADIGWLLTGRPTTPADGSMGDIDLTNVSTEIIVSELRRRLREQEEQALETLRLAVDTLKRLDRLRFSESPKTPEK